MTFSNKKRQSTQNKFEQTARDINSEDIEKAARNGDKKLQELYEKSPGALIKLWNDLKLMVRLLKDYSAGTYTDVPWKVMASITAAIIYFVSPIDVIPDFIPFAGYIDDAYVIKLALDFARDDVSRYRAWRSINQQSI
ncbi:YkvA family protein [Psychromonas sp. SA13A]|uniref:YkvA family protein n=1 Tax=Psychromonas sp. SA13A TaxID=2686346 RepID=UPI001409D60E|nr:YkvA family protein [Psychromonas sp. SA13A]